MKIISKMDEMENYLLGIYIFIICIIYLFIYLFIHSFHYNAYIVLIHSYISRDLVKVERDVKDTIY